MKNARDESLIRDAFLEGLRLETRQVGLGDSDIDPLIFAQSIARDLSITLKIRLCRVNRNPFTFLIGTKNFLFFFVELIPFFHVALPRYFLVSFLLGMTVLRNSRSPSITKGTRYA